ncbi:tail fiber domain-containing protein [Salinarchaeum laminariae]|uniref:tail fiber domain-containing protein n=1 Tax=Salinarchaeum laminariae TaxID=869888 RepID=UPI0020BDEF4C|nr:tail fiber domain-containing protein [Salinarchaeum laminariae]
MTDEITADGDTASPAERVDHLERRVARLRTRLLALEGDRDASRSGGGSLSRRSLLGALGIAGLAGFGVSTASADPQGQIGTQSDPLEELYVQTISGADALTLVTTGTSGNAGPIVAGNENNESTDDRGTVIAGGGTDSNPNRVTSKFATIGGGFNNEASDSATVAGGYSNVADGNVATIAGGDNNVASGYAAGIGSGESNDSLGYTSFVGGGGSNTASGDNATVAGGQNNEASGSHSMVAGGQDNTASAPNSFAAGTNARASNNGAFVWSDTSTGGFISANDDEFAVLASGGTYIFSDSSATTGVQLSSGSGSWSTASSRTLKSDVDPVDGPAVLDKVQDLDIATWSYDGETEDVRHMGPMAEEFSEAFELGDDEQAISNVDADGVALAAIQGLAKRLEDRKEETDDRIDELETENESLRAEKEAMREELDELREAVETLQNAAISADGGEDE